MSTTATAGPSSSPLSLKDEHGNLLQGLSLDIAILEMLLNRHRNGHGRTKYHQRCSMALKTITDRYQIEECFGKRLQELNANIIKHLQQDKYDKRRMQDEWVIESTRKPAKQPKIPAEQSEIIDDLSIIHDVVVEAIPEALSRIHLAASSLLIEVSRGYFLPFCTVALSTLARIRSILMRLAHDALVHYLPTLHAQVLNCKFSKQGRDILFEQCPLLVQTTKPTETETMASSSTNSSTSASSNTENGTVRSTAMKKALYAIAEIPFSAAAQATKRDRTIETMRQLGLSLSRSDIDMLGNRKLVGPKASQPERRRKKGDGMSKKNSTSSDAKLGNRSDAGGNSDADSNMESLARAPAAIVRMDSAEDLGVDAMSGDAVDPDEDPTTAGGASIKQHIDRTGRRRRAAPDEVDQNASLLELVKGRRNHKAKAKPKTAPSGASSSNSVPKQGKRRKMLNDATTHPDPPAIAANAHPDDAKDKKKKKSKKKKKKSQKGDFFDSLFG